MSDQQEEKYDPTSTAGVPEHGRERLERMKGASFFTSDLTVNEFLLVKEGGQRAAAPQLQALINLSPQAACCRFSRSSPEDCQAPGGQIDETRGGTGSLPVP